MPRYEYVDHEGNAHVIAAADRNEAIVATFFREAWRTGNTTLADRASGTVEQSDERSRAA